MPLRPQIASLPAYVPGARAATGAAAFKLSSNENPHPVLPAVMAAIVDAAADTNRYPDMYATELVAALAAQVGVEADQVVVGNGSVAVLGHILAAVVNPGDEVIYGWRSFEAYPIAVAIAGGVSVQVPLLDARGHSSSSTGSLTSDPERAAFQVDGGLSEESARREAGRLDLPAMARAITERTKVIFVCSPNNPTGPIVHHGEMATFMESVPGDVLVVLDEAYLEFVRDPLVADGLALFEQYPNLVLLRTFSKAYGLAGLRVGYVVARARLAAGIRAAATPFGVSHIAQQAALASLRVKDQLDVQVQAIVDERTRMVAGLTAQGWELPDSQANFVWFEVGDATSTCAAQAGAAGVIVRPFVGDGLRVSIGEPEATDIFLKVAQTWR